jgi:hypothetical protein
LPRQGTGGEPTETALAPISVSVRTRFATENDFWNIRSSSLTFR